MSNTTIQLKKSGQSGNTPADLNYGEVAINYADGKLFYKNGVGIKSIENQKTFSTINANNSLIIATTPTDILSLVAGSNITINSNTTTKTVTINSISDDTVAFAAYAQANNASGNTVALQAVNDTQNTNITSVNTFTQAAYNKANNALANTAGAIFGGDLLIGAGGKLNVLTVGGDEGGEILLGKAVSNTTLNGTGVTIDVYQNKIRFFEQGGSARGFYLDISTGGGAASTNIMSGGGGGGGNDNVAFAAYAQANNASGNTVALQSQMTTTNTNISSINTLATSAYGKANAESEINNTQNTNITSVNSFAGSAFNSANAGITLATSAYGKANAEGEINNTQNTWITNTNTLAQAAYNHANTRFSSSGGTISGNVIIQNNLDVLGNVTFIGNVTSIQVTGNSGQFFGYASNGFNALYAGIPVGYDFQPQTVFQVSANEDGYAQINIQNINTGGNASSDLVATADNGTENDTYVSVGIGSSTHNDPDFTLVGPNDGYLYVSGNTVTGGGDLVVGTFLPQNDIVFAAGGMNAENEQMRIIGSSNTVTIQNNLRVEGNNVTIGYSAGANTQGNFSIAIGYAAGQNNQNIAAIAVGVGAGQLNQSDLSVALGYLAGGESQGLKSVAVGPLAAQISQNNYAIAVGSDAGRFNQGNVAIAIGHSAGNSNQGPQAVGIGYDAGASTQGERAVAIGNEAGKTDQSESAVAIGYIAGQTNQGFGAVAVGAGAGINTQGSYTVAIGLNAARNPQSEGAIAVGQSAAEDYQGESAVAVGRVAGQQSQGNNAVAIGYAAGRSFQGYRSIAIGYEAGRSNQPGNSIIISANGQLNAADSGLFIDPIRANTATNVLYYDISTKEITYGAGQDLAGNNVTIGYSAGANTQGVYAVAIGSEAGKTIQGDYAVAIGPEAGKTNQKTAAVAVGPGAGGTNQSEYTVALGYGAGAGSQGLQAVAVGGSAGQSNQGIVAVAVGPVAGQYDQRAYAVALGWSAGQQNQGNNAVAIGPAAGNQDQGYRSIAIGHEAGYSSQAANSIVVSANGLLNAANSGLFIDPIRANTATDVLYYNTTTKEITYGVPTGGGGGGGTTTLISDVRAFSATSGQTVFTVPTYTVGENRIRVFINGVRQNNVVDYTETNPTTITLIPGAVAGDNVVFEITSFDGALAPTQNTWINNTNNFAVSAYDTANAGVALAQAAYGEANAATAVNSTQNTNITSVNTFAQAAYNQANTVPTNINTRGIQANTTYYPTFVDANNSTASTETVHTHANLNFNPSTGTFQTSSGDFRAPIFYDSVNTAFFVNPNDESKLYRIQNGPYAGSATTNNITGLEILNNGGTGDSNLAAMSFHCSGQYGTHFHLRADGYLGAGGWSATSWRWYVLMTNGDMTAAGNVTAYSDPRLKEDIKPVNNALSRISTLNGVRFKWKQSSVIGHPGEYDYGVLANEVAEQFPEIVADSLHEAPEGDKYKTVAYDKLVPILIEAIKELNAKIEKLENAQKAGE